MEISKIFHRWRQVYPYQDVCPCGLIRNRPRDRHETIRYKKGKKEYRGPLYKNPKIQYCKRGSIKKRTFVEWLRVNTGISA